MSGCGWRHHGWWFRGAHNVGVDEADLIWNRAALSNGGGSPGAGDTALVTALAFHGLAMSGGVLDAFERTLADVTQTEAAFRWLGLESIAALLASVRQDAAAGALGDDDRAEALEREADERYNAILPSDAVLQAAFRARLKEDPGAFAGLQGGAR
jgi:hypothetical protein